MEPDERTFRSHLAGARFQQGVDAGDWRMLNDAWPNPIFAVAAAARETAPDELALRFSLSGYPTTGPTAAPWAWDEDDDDAGVPLPAELWPTGGRVATAFNPGWKPNAIYIAMDRLAIEGHEAWRIQHPGLIWDPSRMTIVDYLKVIYELLHSSQYTGIVRAA